MGLKLGPCGETLAKSLKVVNTDRHLATNYTDVPGT
jgi:hypothetical protein